MATLVHAQRLATVPEVASEPVPERMLAVAVIRQALADVATHIERHGQIWVETTAASDAREFLLVRLWERDNLWGTHLRPYLRPSMREDLARFCRGEVKLMKRPHATPEDRPQREPVPV